MLTIPKKIKLIANLVISTQWLKSNINIALFRTYFFLLLLDFFSFELMELVDEVSTIFGVIGLVGKYWPFRKRDALFWLYVIADAGRCLLFVTLFDWYISKSSLLLNV